MSYEIQSCPSGVPTGTVLGRAGTLRAGVKRLRTISEGGRNRDLALVQNGRIVMGSAALMVPCVCDHDRHLHEDHDAVYKPTGRRVVVEKCMMPGCQCIFYRPRRGRVDLSVVKHQVVPPAQSGPAESTGRIISP